MAVVTLNPCFKVILCGLAKPVLVAITQIINAQITVLQAELATAQAALAVTKLALIPVQVVGAIAQQEIAAAQSIANLVPVSVMMGCADFGGFMTTINGSLAAATAGARNIEQNVNRYLARLVELKAAAAAIQSAIDTFEAAKAAIQDALTPGSCP